MKLVKLNSNEYFCGMACKFQINLKCGVCTIVHPTECKKFRVAYSKLLAKEIVPFKYSAQQVSSRVVISANINKAKSYALQCALSKHSKVVKLTTNQVISLVLNNESVDASVVYIELDKKVFADKDKIVSVLQSFIDLVTLHGGYVVLFKSPESNITLNVDKI